MKDRFIFVIIAICMLAGLAHAEEAATPIGESLKGIVMGDIIPLVVAIVGGLVSLLVLKIRQRFNIQLSAETEQFIRNQAEHAVQLVAEKAAAKIKYDVKLTSSEKLNMAVAALVAKVPALTKEQADAYVHAALARIKGEGATGDQALTPGGGNG